MKILTSILSFGILAVVASSCKARKVSDESGIDQVNAKVSQVDATAFNAYQIWRDGKGRKITEYPGFYEDSEYFSIDSENEFYGVFYFPRAEFNKDENNSIFVATPTQDAKVEGNLLIYPVRNAQQLKLKFSKREEDSLISHSGAVNYCKSKNLRLPSAREIFDFCATGVTEIKYGNVFLEKYPKNARCNDGKDEIWTSSLWSFRTSYAWTFSQHFGVLQSYGMRGMENNTVWCVGPAD